MKRELILDLEKPNAKEVTRGDPIIMLEASRTAARPILHKLMTGAYCDHSES